MALNYNFINDVSSDVRNEISRRQAQYWSSTSTKTSLEWNYQKTAYLILTALQGRTVDAPGRYVKANNNRYTPPKPAMAGTQPWPPANFQAGVDNEEVSIKSEKITEYKEVGRISAPRDAVYELYASNGTIRKAILNSAEITSDGTYGSILRITVNFTVFDVNELDRYVKRFLTPGVDIGLEYGWLTDEKISVNNGKIRGTVYNFTFSAKEDGSWDCTLNALGPSSMTYGFNLYQQGVSKEVSLSNRNTIHLQEIFKTILDVTDHDYETTTVNTSKSTCKVRDLSSALKIGYLASNTSKSADITSILNQYADIKTYIFSLPVDKSLTLGSQLRSYLPIFLGGFGALFGGGLRAQTNTSKITYITLRSLVDIINIYISSIIQKDIPLYTFNGFDKDNNMLDDVCLIKSNKFFLTVGPADFSKFAFTTQINGIGESSFNFDISQDVGTTNGTAEQKIADLVLVNVQFIYSEITNILDNNKNLSDKKIVTFLNNIFQQLEIETGGHINLTIVDAEKNKTTGTVEWIQILNQNYVPDSIKLNPLPIIAMTKGSVVRSLSVESSVPDAVQTEVATYIRANESYVGNDGNISDVQESLKNLRAELFNLNINFMDNIKVDDQQMQTSLSNWQAAVRGIYRKMYTYSQSSVLANKGSNISSFSLIDLKTAIFPIRLKIIVDGIEGFQYGNAITTNWVPTQYKDRKLGVYWTVVKIRHVIENNDWYTELETIYRILS